VSLSDEARERILQESAGFSPCDIRSLVSTMSVMGADTMADELVRIRKQRELYAGDACQRFRSGDGVGRTVYHDEID